MKRFDLQTTIANLLEQRRGFVETARAGQLHVLASIQFIDNVLSKLDPDYVPDLVGLDGPVCE